jgi:2-hydroxychromene-2-carboxylate isomerase
MASKKIEFWFEYGSTYTYLTVARLASLAQARGVSIEWRPFLLMPIMIDQGMQQGPFLPFPAKLRYMWRDLERRARRHGIPWRRPSAYPPPNVLTSARIGYFAQNEGWCAAFTQEVFRLHWTEDVLIGTEENIRRSLEAVRKNVGDILAIAQSEDNKAGLRRQTEQAKSLGIFGSPTFIVSDELFWGDDRLEDALDFIDRQ